MKHIYVYVSILIDNDSICCCYHIQRNGSVVKQSGYVFSLFFFEVVFKLISFSDFWVVIHFMVCVTNCLTHGSIIFTPYTLARTFVGGLFCYSYYDLYLVRGIAPI